jgi:hypothetical protein
MAFEVARMRPMKAFEVAQSSAYVITLPSSGGNPRLRNSLWLEEVACPLPLSRPGLPKLIGPV